MKNIKVLGSGCAKCQKTAELIQRIADEKNVQIVLEKVTDPMQIMTYNVMSTPAVVMDESVVHKGSIPKTTDVEEWLTE